MIPINTVKNCPEDTLVSLKEYADARFQAMENAVKTARDSMEKRLDSMNEFREQLNDQSNTLLSRNEFYANHKQLSDKIDNVQHYVWMGTGIAVAFSFIISLLGIILSALKVFGK